MSIALKENENKTQSVLKDIKYLEQECRDQMFNNGFMFTGSFDTSNKVVKFNGRGEEGKEKTEWYRAESKIGSLQVTYNSHHDSLKNEINYRYYSKVSKPLTEKEHQAEKKRVQELTEARKKKEDQEKIKREAQALKDRERFNRAAEKGFSLYLERKQVGSYGIRFEGNIVLIPMINEAGEIQALQEIHPEKKLFPTDKKPRDKHFTNATKGLYHVIGQLKNGEPIRMSEGYATAASVYESTECKVPHVIAFSASQYKNIIPIIKKLHPDSPIIICADNDKREGSMKNTGLDEAFNVAKEFKCDVVFPTFPEGSEKDNKDFNDLMILQGKDAVKKQTEKKKEEPIKKQSKNQSHEDYFLNENGLYYLPNNINEEETKKQPEFISSPIYPVAHLRDLDGKNHSILLRVYDGEKEHFWAMHRSKINKFGDIAEILLDLGQNSPIQPSKQKHLQTYLMHLRPEKHMRCVNKPGWHSGQYVFPDGEVIGKGEEGGEGVYPINEACPQGLKCKGTLEEWQESVFKYCLGNSRLLFSVGTAFASFCLGIMEEEGGGFNIKGASSTGKSTCLYVAISVIGSREYKRSWKATVNGIEGICSLHNDSLLALDEMGQAEGKDIGDSVYMIAQGIGKGRLHKDGSMRETKTWRTMLLSTGEVGLTEHMHAAGKKPKAGQLTRIVDIPAEVKGAKTFRCFETIHDQSNGDDFAKELDRKSRAFYGTAGREFIEKTIAYGIDKAKKDIQFSIDDFVADNAKDCSGQVSRVARRFGLVSAALSLAVKLGILGNKFTQDEASSAIKTCYLDWLSNRETKGDLESHNLIEQVIGLLKENSEGKFALRDDSTPDNKIRQTLWGTKEGSHYFVYPKAFKEDLCKGHDSTQAAKALIAAGLLKPSNEGKSSQSKRIYMSDKKSSRCYVIELPDEESFP